MHGLEEKGAGEEIDRECNGGDDGEGFEKRVEERNEHLGRGSRASGGWRKVERRDDIVK